MGRRARSWEDRLAWASAFCAASQWGASEYRLPSQKVHEFAFFIKSKEGFFAVWPLKLPFEDIVCTIKLATYSNITQPLLQAFVVTFDCILKLHGGIMRASIGAMSFSLSFRAR